MIVCNHELFIEQLKIIDLKSYENYWCDDKWKSVLESRYYLFRIFTLDEIVGGFSCYRKVNNFIFLERLCVRESLRGQGIGSALMDDFIKSFQGLTKRCLLREDNQFLTWAAAWGWKAIDLKKGVFDGIDGIIMENIS